MLQDSIWLNPPSQIHINDDEVHIWRVPLTFSGWAGGKLGDLLSAEETKRAECFRFHKDRIRYIVSHSALRSILGAYLNMNGRRLIFSCNKYGKPFLSENSETLPIQFNFSHAGDYALVAITLERAIGVDIEYIQGDVEIADISRFFSDPEKELMEGLGSVERPLAFFNCWTRKEAYIKARGQGLTYPLNRFEVSLRPGDPAKLIRVDKEPDEVFRWRMEDIYVAPDYSATLVVESGGCSTKHWQWSGYFPPTLLT